MKSPITSILALILAMLWFTPTDAAPRVWVDRSGKSSLEANLNGVKDGMADLRLLRSGTVTVPIYKLSREDVDYIREHADWNLGLKEKISYHLKRWRFGMEKIHDSMPALIKNPRVALGIAAASLLLIVLAKLNLLFLAFGKSIGWGISCLFIPGMLLIYALADFGATRTTLFWLLLGILLMIAGLVAYPEPNFARLADLLIEIPGN